MSTPVIADAARTAYGRRGRLADHHAGAAAHAAGKVNRKQAEL